MFVQFKQLNY